MIIKYYDVKQIQTKYGDPRSIVVRFPIITCSTWGSILAYHFLSNIVNWSPIHFGGDLLFYLSWELLIIWVCIKIWESPKDLLEEGN